MTLYCCLFIVVRKLVKSHRIRVYPSRQEKSVTYVLTGPAVLSPATSYSLLVTRYSLLVTCYSLLVTRYSLLVTRYSLLATRYSLLLLASAAHKIP